MSTEQANQENTTEQPNLAADDGMSFLDEQPAQVGSAQDNSGALYPNLSRKKESHPNCRGKALVEGVWMWVSGWNNIMPSGKSRYISLAFTKMTPEDIIKYCTDKPKAAATTPAQTTEQAPAQTTEQVEQAAVTTEAQVEETKDEIF